MWRAMFLAIGIFACILGAECLAIDKAILKVRHEPAPGFSRDALNGTGRRREVIPPDWAPWSLLSVGAVTMLYSFTIPKRVKD